MNLFGDLAGQLLGGQQGAGGIGGVAGLAQLFQSKGLGDVVSSWIGTGANLPVSPSQIQEVLGNEQIGQLAAKLGLSSDQASAHLAEFLPGLVDKLTPNGEVPDSGDLMSMGQNLLQSFFSK